MCRPDSGTSPRTHRSRSGRYRGLVRWAAVGKEGTEHKRHKRSQETQKICASCDFLCLLWSIPLLLLCCLSFCFSLCDLGLVVLIAHERDVDPGMAHFIHGAVAESNPLVRIRIVWIIRSVVVPRCDLQDRALGKERGDIIRIHVVVVPVEIEIIHMA